MVRSVIIIMLLAQLAFCGCAPAGPQVNFNKPDQTITNADIDYAFLKNIDQITPPYPADSSYQIGDIPTIKGQYTINKYILEYDAHSAEKGRTKFHDLIVIKVDKDSKIIDGYKYTLEWADTPSLALYRLSKTNLYLKLGLKIDDLGFTKGDKENKMIKTVTIMVANEDGKPIRRQQIGTCDFYADYSFKIKTDHPEIAGQLTAAIKRARQKESLLLRSENNEGDKLVMTGEMLKPGDKDYLYALITEAARIMNENSRTRYFSFEY